MNRTKKLVFVHDMAFHPSIVSAGKVGREELLVNYERTY